ncbi:hypothetical protein BJ742DRAFT_841001 [Cladochytrium replicatum]|nr:hypothetical protein BJ742DRAFT_841001 [Cladochytrium replicatum]
MLSVPMLQIVAAKSFDPALDAYNYLASKSSPLLGREAISIKAGQTLFAIGYDPDHALFFATNCKQMPFCSIATTGYIPLDVFHPVQGFHFQRPSVIHDDVDVDMDDASPPHHSASLSTPASSAHPSASEMDENIHKNTWDSGEKKSFWPVSEKQTPTTTRQLNHHARYYP